MSDISFDAFCVGDNVLSVLYQKKLDSFTLCGVVLNDIQYNAYPAFCTVVSDSNIFHAKENIFSPVDAYYRAHFKTF